MRSGQTCRTLELQIDVDCSARMFLTFNPSIYIKAKRAGWLSLYLCVRVARQRWAVAMQRGRFLFGQF
jgi:hypothetical protein